MGLLKLSNAAASATANTGSKLVSCDNIRFVEVAIANAGVPLEELVSLAQYHSSNVNEVVNRAISLFEEHIKEGTEVSSEKDLALIMKDLLPSVIRLVAQHFHKSLVTRSLERIDGHNKTILSNALIASDPENLVVTCEWR